MADISAEYLSYFGVGGNSAAEVPQERFDVGQDSYLFESDMFSEPKASYMKGAHLGAADPVLAGKLDPELGGPVYDPRQQRLDVETAVAAGHYPQSNNFWLTPQASNQQLMAFQPALPNQLPPVGAEYQIQSGMDSIASPYSPESEGSLGDDQVEGSFQLPPGFDPSDEKGLLKLTEEQLVSLTARDLNRLCRDLPEDIIKQLKKRRRTLKNRGYAYNSRVRRVSQKNQLEKERDELQKQIAQLQDRVKSLEREATLWKQKAQSYDRSGENQ